MDTLSADDLSACLVGHLNPDLIKILNDQKINGSRFMKLSENTLKLFNFQLCDILDITTLISDIKEGSKDIIVRHDDENQSPDKLHDSKDLDSGESQSGEADGALDKDDPNRAEADKVLKSLVKDSYLKSLSQYDQLNLRRICSNWLRLGQAGLPSTTKPNLCLPKSAYIDGESSKENSPLQKKSKIAPTRKSARSQVVEQVPTKVVSKILKEKSTQGSGSRRQLSKPQQRTDREIIHKDKHEENSDSETVSGSKLYKKPLGMVENVKKGSKNISFSDDDDDDENQSANKLNDSKDLDSGESQSGEADGALDKDDPNRAEADKVLKSLVKDSYLKSLSQYDQLNLRRICSNWLRLGQAGLPSTTKPNLCLPKSAYIDGESSKENSPPHKKSKTLPTRKSARTQMVKPVPTKEVSKILKEKSSQSSGSRRQLLKPQELTDEENINEHEDRDDDDSDSETVSASKMYKLPPGMDHFKTADELLSEKPHLQSFNVEEILINADKTKQLVPYLNQGFLFIEQTRKLIFRTLVRHICYKYVEHPTKVSGAMREALAKSFVVKYPQFQKLVPVPDQTSWSHVVSNFANIYKRVLTQLPKEERPRKGKKQKKIKKISTTCDVDIEVLATINPDSTHREEILDGMRKSFKVRVASRLRGDSITEMLQKFPQFKHYNGEVISLEFSLMFTKACDMVRVFTPLVAKVLEKYSAAKNLHTKSGLDEMKVFLYLATMLPRSIDKDAPTGPIEKEILAIVKVGKSTDEYVETRRLNSKSHVQPYLIGIKGTASDCILKYFLVLDSVTIQLGNVSFIRAVDWLFKSYHVFNVHYPLSWRNFFRFLQTCMYKVFVGTSDDVLPSAQNLFSKLLSL